MKIDTDALKKINLNEAAYDSALLIFPFFLGRIYNTAMKSAVFGIPFPMLFLLATIYFLPVMIGKMYNIEYRNSPKSVKKALIFIIVSGTIFAYGSLLNMTITGVALGETMKSFVFLSGTVFLIMGPIAGIVTAPESVTGDELPVQMIIFLFTLGILPLFFMLVSGQEIFGDVNGLLVFLIIIGLMIGDTLFIVLLYGLFILIRRLLVKLGVLDGVRFITRLLIPFCISFILVFFNIYGDRVILGGVGVRGPGSVLLIIFFYVITGIIPLRILLMLSPPVRPVNVLLGVFSTSVMVYVLAIR